MSESLRGMPLLSGQPPEQSADTRTEASCRKCNREFNMLFTRSRKCNHCGYLYCHSCTDYQALLPRSGVESGYDPMPVCAFCIEMLTLTAGGKGYLKSQPLAKLKGYIQAYNISLGNDILEKDDVVNAIIAAREQNGCLPRAKEDYYRKYSVPNGQNSRPRAFFARPSQGRTGPRQSAPPPPPRPPQPPSFSRPDLNENRPPPDPPRPNWNDYPGQNRPPPRPQAPRPSAPGAQRSTSQTQNSSYGSGAPPHSYAPPPYAPYTRRTPPTSRPQSVPPVPPGHPPVPPQSTRPQTQSTRPATQPPPTPPRPAPSLDELLNMTHESIQHLPVSALKAILFQNHVNVRNLLEKADLVSRVVTLVSDERAERAREAAIHEAEQQELRERQHRLNEERNARQGQQSQHSGEGQSRDGTAGEKKSPADPKSSVLERNGLCVVCQDEEANIAVVDCGHLALCRSCSELVMQTSRECPLCRTRIVTEARLLRIFKS